MGKVAVVGVVGRTNAGKSTLVNRLTLESPGAFDLAGNARVNGRTVDLGAYELVVKGLLIIVR